MREQFTTSSAVVVADQGAALQQLQLSESASFSVVESASHAYSAHDPYLACDPSQRLTSTLSHRLDQVMSARFAQLPESFSPSTATCAHAASPHVRHQVSSSRSPASIPMSKLREFVSSMPARFAKTETTRQWGENRTNGSASFSADASVN